MRLDAVLHKDPDIVFRKIAGEYVLVPIRHRVGDLDNIYTLNETAARIWELIDGRRTLAEIRDALAREFAVPAAQAEADLLEYAAALHACAAVGQDPGRR
ncbi:MAG: PqqD family protein [Deltaproteobacteria bacterium]